MSDSLDIHLSDPDESVRTVKECADLGEAMRVGVEPGSMRANELAEKHRKALNWFDVTPAKHIMLARMFVADPRFTEHYDEVAPGPAT